MLNLKFKTSPQLKLATATLLTIALTGCGGGGGSSNVKPNSTADSNGVKVVTEIKTATQAPGLSVSLRATYNNATNKATISAVTFDPNFKLTTVGSVSTGNVTSLEINSTNATTTGSTFKITQDANHTVTNVPGSATGSTNVTTNSSEEYIKVVQSSAYSYTQFGEWYQCSSNCNDTGTSNEVAGFFINGTVTAPANIPTTGTYTYKGNVYGVGIDAQGNASDGAADMTATANFATRNIAFATTNTTVNATTARPELNMSGTLAYAAGENLFSGAVTTAGTGNYALTGTAKGRFYGPAAQEIGGLFVLSGAGGNLAGGFVGK